MKVAIIAGEIPSTTFINRLVLSLADSGTQIYVCGNIYSRPKSKKKMKYLGINKRNLRVWNFFVEFLSKWHARFTNEKSYRKLIKSKLTPTIIDFELVRLRPDIVHVQWAKDIENYVWVQQFGIKLVLSLRGAHINYSPVTVPNLAETYKKIFPKIDRFHGVSQAICIEAVKYGADLNKCHVVYSGFNLNHFPRIEWKANAETEKMPSLLTRSVKIISVGRPHWIKGYNVALDAMRILKDENLLFNYKIIGAADDEELMFQTNQLDLNDNVELLTKMTFEEVKTYIQEADLLLLPSIKEGIANVVVEAMLLGTFVISTDCGGVREVIQNGKNGFLVPIRNPQEIAKAVKKVIHTSPRELRIMRENAYGKAIEQHNGRRMAQDMVIIYETAIKNAK